MRREAVAVFEEEMWEEVVAEQSVDLKYHCGLSKRVEKKKLIKFEGQHTQYNR
jgi:hypothetical protein